VRYWDITVLQSDVPKSLNTITNSETNPKIITPTFIWEGGKSSPTTQLIRKDVYSK